MFPPKIERVGGTLISLHRWGGRVGGQTFAWGGYSASLSPPIGGEKRNYDVNQNSVSLFVFVFAV